MPAPIAAVSALPSWYTLIQTAKLNDVDPQTWLADGLGRVNDQNIHNLDQLLPWNWKTQPARLAA
jgi:transposase